ncbi:MAG: hypothetical protein LBR20_03440 [Propionibacteriaceae bacterium]|jgi:hypothetical protein|nr:hypothetical protein [Propionibacteriaceae bacterium]
MAKETKKPTPLTLSFEGTHVEINPDKPFYIGREGDFIPDENPYLHRRALEISYSKGFWWLVNTGTRISVTVADPKTGAHTWLTPGSRTPLMFDVTVLSFTAGPWEYEMLIHNKAPNWQGGFSIGNLSGQTTIGTVTLTLTQKQLIVSLCEPALRREGTGTAAIPSNAAAAERLGWTGTRFARKLDNVCDKLDRIGVEGLRGGYDGHAYSRRARLVEFALSTGLVTAVDLQLLDQESDDEND